MGNLKLFFYNLPLHFSSIVGKQGWSGEKYTQGMV